MASRSASSALPKTSTSNGRRKTRCDRACCCRESEAGSGASGAADPIRNTTFWSEEIFTILEWPDRTQPPFDAAVSLYLPASRHRIESAVARCLTHGTAFDIEAEMHSARGRPIWVRVAGEAERDASGAAIRVVGAFQDITDLKRAQTEQLRLTQRLGATLESMSDAFYLLDRDWNIAFMNSEAERALGVQRADLIGRTFWTAFAHTHSRTRQAPRSNANTMRR
jgi:PAS domain-containing protein